MPLNAIALNCTLKSDASATSSTDAMIAVLEKAFGEVDVTVTERFASLRSISSRASLPTKAKAMPGLPCGKRFLRTTS